MSNNSALIPNPSISYTNGSSTATLTYIPTTDTSGSAVITVTATETAASPTAASIASRSSSR